MTIQDPSSKPWIGEKIWAVGNISYVGPYLNLKVGCSGTEFKVVQSTDPLKPSPTINSLPEKTSWKKNNQGFRSGIPQSLPKSELSSELYTVKAQQTYPPIVCQYDFNGNQHIDGPEYSTAEGDHLRGTLSASDFDLIRRAWQTQDIVICGGSTPPPPPPPPPEPERIEVRFKGVVVDQRGDPIDSAWWIVRVEEVTRGRINGSVSVTYLYGAICPRQHMDQNIKIGDKVDVFGRYDGNEVWVCSDNYFMRKIELPQVNISPFADFTWSPQNPEQNQSASFIDRSTDSDGFIQSRHWNFGDGNSSTVQNPSHTFGRSGSMNVCLTVTDNRGDQETICKNVSITRTREPEPDPSQEIRFRGTVVSNDPLPDASSITITVDEVFQGPLSRGSSLKVMVFTAFGLCSRGSIDDVNPRDHVEVYGQLDGSGAEACSKTSYYVRKISGPEPQRQGPTARFSWNPNSPELNQSISF